MLALVLQWSDSMSIRQLKMMAQLTPGLDSGLVSTASLVRTFESLAEIVLVPLLPVNQRLKTQGVCSLGIRGSLRR